MGTAIVLTRMLDLPLRVVVNRDGRFTPSEVDRKTAAPSRFTEGCSLSLGVLYAEVDPHGHRLYEG
jgi:hypothetical protein